MRISTLQQHSGLLQELQTASQQHVHDWNRVASGQKYTRPAENPLASAQISMVKKEISLLESYLNNGQALQSQLQLEEGLLHSYSNYLQRTQALVLQANSGVMDQQGLNIQAGEIARMKDAIIDLLNTRDAEGEYVFGGFQSDLPPVTLQPDGQYRFNMNQQVREVSVASYARVEGWDTASKLCFQIGDGDNRFNLLSVLDSLTGELKAPTTDLSTHLAEYLMQLDQAAVRAESIHADVGARLNQLITLKEGHEKAIIDYQSQLSALADLDYTEALTSLNRQQVMLEATRKGLQRVTDLSLFKYI